MWSLPVPVEFYEHRAPLASRASAQQSTTQCVVDVRLVGATGDQQQRLIPCARFSAVASARQQTQHEVAALHRVLVEVGILPPPVHRPFDKAWVGLIP